ncbi:zinc finger CCCH domain-containing protein 11A-like [Tympanuchus pallidicinctus]|uniref:zinc finger CCCH domain-containing protein 11A-like n=1 Tax=Tympanuchus pallidicinctus TaxID=109042 RepID=UPI0022876944|nr:zinc finger CCCH domain-containing protein 11A-like [Tympanuchus pallidicinctus]
MSQHGDERGSNSRSVRAKGKGSSAARFPAFGSSSQQAARDPTAPGSAQRDAMGTGRPHCHAKNSVFWFWGGCGLTGQRCSWGLCNHTGSVVAGTEPARPWDGAGHGGKRKASPDADASSLPAKRSLAERQGRSTECGTAPKRDRGAESNGKIDPKAVQEGLSGRACLQAGGLPTSAGPSSGGRPAPAVCPRSVSKSLAAGKRKGLEEEQQTSALLPACKRARRQSGGSVPAPAAQPGPAAARSSKLRARRRRQKERRRELKKASLRAAAAHTEVSPWRAQTRLLLPSVPLSDSRERCCKVLRAVMSQKYTQLCV